MIRLKLYFKKYLITYFKSFYVHYLEEVILLR